MLKKLSISLIIFFFYLSLSAQDNAQYRFTHGPYLQGTTANGTYIYFTTSNLGLSHIEIRKENREDIQKYYEYNDGLIEIDTISKIKITGLQPNTVYEYRLISKEVPDFGSYYIKYGDSIASDWYKFKTFDPYAKKASFAIVNDMHDTPDKYSKLLSYIPLDKADMIFLNGDMINSFYKKDQLFTSFIDVSVEKFATEKPFALVRGNHETRGPLARQLKNFVLRPNGTLYSLYMLGKTAVLMLDAGEDKYDHHNEYYGATAFDRYREEQAVWLKEAVKTKEFTDAKRRIVIIHIPPFRNREVHDPVRPGNHSLNEIKRLFMPILNNADVDVMFCGHIHRHSFLDVKKGENNFPILINDNKSIIWVESTAMDVKVTVTNESGEETFNRTFN